MGTRRVSKSKSRSAQPIEANSIANKPSRGSLAKSTAKPKHRKRADAPDNQTKTTALNAHKASIKLSSADSRSKSSRKAATNNEESGRAVEPAGTNATRRRRASSPEGKAQRHETNGPVAGHDRADAVSMQANETHEAQPAKAAAQSKACRAPRAERVLQSLFEALDAHAKSRSAGHVVQDTLFDWGDTENQSLFPDLAFVSFDRWARYRYVPKDRTWHVAPDLVVKIVRSSEQTESISTCLELYFRAGVNRVWVVYPNRFEIHDHDSLASSRVLGSAETLDGGTILPGFQMPVKAMIGEGGGEGEGEGQ
jgi:hypothetical protein